MNKIRTKILAIGLIFISIVLASCGQTREEKTLVIINKLDLIETQKNIFKFQIESIKYQATGEDSVRVLELEKQLSDEEMLKQTTETLNKILSKEELDDIYEFVQSNAFEKYFISGELHKAIAAQFDNIDSEIESITNNLSKSIKNPSKKHEPIPIERENGFYATVDYKRSVADKDIKLENKPSLSPKDILEVNKVFSTYNNQPEISIVFTKEGARKFHLLTKENIGKPIAVVIAKHIVTMPIVNSEIIGGKASISGDYTEKEIDKMIEILKEK